MGWCILWGEDWGTEDCYPTCSVELLPKQDTIFAGSGSFPSLFKTDKSDLGIDFAGTSTFISETNSQRFADLTGSRNCAIVFKCNTTTSETLLRHFSGSTIGFQLDIVNSLAVFYNSTGSLTLAIPGLDIDDKDIGIGWSVRKNYSKDSTNDWHPRFHEAMIYNFPEGLMTGSFTSQSFDITAGDYETRFEFSGTRQARLGGDYYDFTEYHHDFVHLPAFTGTNFIIDKEDAPLIDSKMDLHTSGNYYGPTAFTAGIFRQNSREFQNSPVYSTPYRTVETITIATTDTGSYWMPVLNAPAWKTHPSYLEYFIADDRANTLYYEAVLSASADNVTNVRIIASTEFLGSPLNTETNENDHTLSGGVQMVSGTILLPLDGDDIIWVQCAFSGTTGSQVAIYEHHGYLGEITGSDYNFDFSIRD